MKLVRLDDAITLEAERKRDSTRTFSFALLSFTRACRRSLCDGDKEFNQK